MKKIFTLLLILSLTNLNCLPTLSANNTLKKPRVNVFNRAVKNGDIEKVKEYIASVVCSILKVSQSPYLPSYYCFLSPTRMVSRGIPSCKRVWMSKRLGFPDFIAEK